MLPPIAARPLKLIRLRKIAACIDRSAFSASVVAHAVRAASVLDAELTLLQVVEPRVAAPPDPIALDLHLREAQQELAQLADEHCSHVAGVKSVVIEGDPAEKICQWVRDHDIDLTVFATHGERGVTQWAFGSTARKLLDGVPGSLLLVPADSPIAGDVSYRTVLVPLDGSSYAESVLPLASRLAADGRTRVVLAHIIPVPELTETAPIEGDALELRARLVDRNRRVAEEYLQQVRARVEGDVKVLIASRNVRTGLAAMIAEEHPDLVVLGAYGGGRRADAPLGSVADYLISHADVPLLVVRDRGAVPARRSVAPIRLADALLLPR